jgi:hypothetical protein
MFGRAVLLGCLSTVVVLWPGCSGDAQRPAAGSDQTAQSAGQTPACVPPAGMWPPCNQCQRDEDCRSGFCDRGKCADLWLKGGLGSECDPNWSYSPPPPGVFNRPIIRPCGGDLLCIDRRCRSCQSDRECRRTPIDQYDVCGSIPETAGYVCHDASLVARGGDATAQPVGIQTRFTPVPARPAVVAPEDGFPHRSVAHGGACIRDGDCRSLFCDRNVCVELYGRGNFGRGCTLVAESTPAERRARATAAEGCGGYLCWDGRCRSCLSDTECRDGLDSPRCFNADHWQGAICEGFFPKHPPPDPSPIPVASPPPGFGTPPPPLPVPAPGSAPPPRQ